VRLTSLEGVAEPGFPAGWAAAMAFAWLAFLLVGVTDLLRNLHRRVVPDRPVVSYSQRRP
jgi:hypothetical protein